MFVCYCCECGGVKGEGVWVWVWVCMLVCVTVMFCRYMYACMNVLKPSIVSVVAYVHCT